MDRLRRAGGEQMVDIMGKTNGEQVLFGSQVTTPSGNIPWAMMIHLLSILFCKYKYKALTGVTKVTMNT